MKNIIKKVALAAAVVSSLQFSVCMKQTNLFMQSVNAAEITAPVKNFDTTTPSKGNLNVLVFKVDFPDVKYADNELSASELQESAFGSENTNSRFYPIESVSSYYNRSSAGKLQVDGNVYSYTAKHERSYYNNKNEYETLVMEILNAYDGQIDYSKYDSDNDGYIDCLSIGVPTNGTSDDNFWYGCQATWYLNSGYSVDGVKIKGYIINDEQPTADNVDTYNRTFAHEMGHSMGLPDYYKYNTTDGNWEGMSGEAGFERMDDSYGDFSAFSKLMYGWIDSDYVQVADLNNDSATYYVYPSNEYPNCLIVPVGNLDKNYFSEYFLIEYVTPKINNSGVFNNSGIRVLHVDASTMKSQYNSKYKSFKYENYSPKYDTSNNGRRILKLVNDGNGFYKAGDTVKFGASNFAAYDSNGKQTIDPGFKIDIGDIDNGWYPITITKTK